MIDVNPSNPGKKKSVPVWTLFFISLGLISTACAFYFGNFHGDLSTKNDDWGTFGDFFGGILNPIFSFMSFLALLVTINLQREELEATNIELARSATAQEMAHLALTKQLETQSKQQFENTFFALLDQHNKVLTDHKALLNNVHAGCLTVNGVNTNLATANKNVHTSNGVVGQYFRVLYQLLKLIATNIPNSNIGPAFTEEAIKNSDLAANEKMYSNIVRSFLDFNTTQLLAINCYCATDDHSFYKFKLLLERYAFLEHMPFTFKGQKQSYIALDELKNHYHPKAFDKNEFKNEPK